MKNARKACAFVLGAALFAPVLASAQNNMPGQQPGQQAAPAVAQPAVAAPAQPSYKDLVAKRKTLLEQKKVRKEKLAQDKKALAQQEEKEIAAVRSDKTLTRTQKHAKIVAIRKNYTDQRKGMWVGFKKDMGGIGSDIAGVGKDMEFWKKAHHKKATKVAKKHTAAVKTTAVAPVSAQ
jgi:hypothetical protein